jgi:hypothetical protein
MAAVELLGPDEPPAHKLRLELFIWPNDPDKIQFGAYVGNPGERVEVMGSVPLTDRSISFEIIAVSPTQARISVAGQAARTLDFSPLKFTRATLLVSSAHARFAQVDVRPQP